MEENKIVFKVKEQEQGLKLKEYLKKNSKIFRKTYKRGGFKWKNRNR